MDPADRPFAVTFDAWRRQLDLLQAAPGFLPVALAAGAGFADAPAEPSTVGWAVTFDDSWATHLDVAAPELQRRGLSGTFFLTTGTVDQPRMVSWTGVRELVAAGYSIGSHGETHCFLSGLSLEELRRELVGSKERLERETARPVTMLSLPGGRGNARVYAQARQAGFARICGSVPGFWDGMTEREMPRLAIRSGEMGTRAVQAVCSAPAQAMARYRRRYWWKACCRRLLGDRLYHTLYAWMHRSEEAS